MSLADVDPRSVPCPHCEADVGDPCLKPDGTDAPNPHARRVADAERAVEQLRARAELEVPDRIKTDRWRRLYSSCRLELEQRGDLTRLAREQLEAMVRIMAQADVARARAAARPTVKGSMGQLVANPLIAVEARLDAQALAHARALKLTPDTRGTSAPELEDGGDDAPPEQTDELAELDELARRRKSAGPKRRRRSA